MKIEPTIEEISRAWTVALQCEGIPGSRSESLYELEKLRNAKTIWVGSREVNFMFAIDSYLRGKQ